jgi:hypothetical protein
MNFLKGSVVFAFLLGIGISTIFGVKNSGNAQTQGSEPIIGQMPPTTKSPIGNNVGLDELTALFKTSEATKAKPIRKVIIMLSKHLLLLRPYLLLQQDGYIRLS